MTRPVNGTIEQIEDYATALELENAELKATLELYEERLRLAQQKRFGASSEKTDPNQLAFAFNEAEVLASDTAEEPELEEIKYKRKKTRRSCKDLLEGLPVQTITYELPEGERCCDVCDGSLHQMSTEIRRELDIIPAQFKVIEHVRHVYSCRACEANETSTPIVVAPAPAPPISQGLASPASLAYIISQKYSEGLPLYRLERQFERIGVPISRQTLSNWVLDGTERCLAPLYDRMHEHLLTQNVLHADETRVQVLKEPGRAAETKSYMWIYCSGRDGPPIFLYDYQQTRSRMHPEAFLSGYSGYLHVDGYIGYEKIDGIVPVGCWAHARRKFHEAVDALPKEQRRDKSTAAQQGLKVCNALFRIERDLEQMTPEERQIARESKSKPVLDEFKEWLDSYVQKVLPKTTLGKAISYCLNQWPKLQRFLEDGRLELSNNRAERSIKRFVIGRKNWIFCNTARGAEASVIAYSLVETAKENGLDPLAYLTYVFEQVPNIDCTNPAAIDAILPWSSTLPDKVKNPKRHKA